MTATVTITGVSIDEASLTLEELARACRVEPSWVIERVEAGLLGNVVTVQRTTWRFASAELARARRLASLERDMDANPELAALVADLIEEVQRLRQLVRSPQRVG
jgi:chaperone modulatory protein CbpM